MVRLRACDQGSIPCHEAINMKKKIDLIPVRPGSWSSINILVDGIQEYTACKTIGPGMWFIFHKDNHITYVGSAISKSGIKAVVRDLMKI